MDTGKLGMVSFYVGLVLAAIVAIVGAGSFGSWVVFVLGILGVIVGLLNVTDKETTPFLLATVAFMVSFAALASLVTTLSLGWEAVQTFFSLLNAFIAPAAAIVALRAIYDIARD